MEALDTISIVMFVLATLVAIVVVILLWRDNAKLRASSDDLRADKASLAAEKAALELRLSLQEKSHADAVAQMEKAQAAIAEERQKNFDSQNKKMEETFKALSEQNSAGLRRQNVESIGELLKPIQDKFCEFDKTVRDTQLKAATQAATMAEMVKNLADQSKSVGDEAKNLANALTGHSKVQGNFGEMLLTNLLKSSGLEEGVHFKTQGVLRDSQGHEIKNDDGGTMLPDVIVYYPDDTEVVIDSKVSLTAYANYAAATALEDRVRYAKEHVASIAKHIDELKAKDYASYIEQGRRKVDFNIMFVPIEGAFRLMLEEAPTLWQRAKDANVVIVSQMTLMIVLNMIQMSWKQHDQEKNIQEVYKTGEELMSQLKAWLDTYVKVGDCIEASRKAYDESFSKVKESKQSVIKKIDKLERLGLTKKRSNAKLATGGRMVGGRESVIPAALADGIDCEDDDTL